jgi:acyl-CoA thioesterase
MGEDIQRLAQAVAQAMWAADSASRAMGMAIEAVGPGRAVLTMTVTEIMVNGHGMCHGGHIFTLADSAFAFACNSHNQNTVAFHCEITYVAPSQLGEVLRAEAIERSRQGRTGVYDVSVTGTSQRLIAEFRGISRTIEGQLIELGASHG